MWSEKQKDNIKVICGICEKELDAGWGDPEEKIIKVGICLDCLDRSEESSFDAGFDEGHDAGYDEGYAHGLEEGDQDD